MLASWGLGSDERLSCSVDDSSELRQSITGDRQALSTARYSRTGQLATADTCSHISYILVPLRLVGPCLTCMATTGYRSIAHTMYTSTMVTIPCTHNIAWIKKHVITGCTKLYIWISCIAIAKDICKTFKLPGHFQHPPHLRFLPAFQPWLRLSLRVT